MKFTADGGDEWTVYSVGGGALSEGKAEGDMFAAGGDVYDMHKIKDIMAWCNKTGHGYWEYVEKSSLHDYKSSTLTLKPLYPNTKGCLVLG